MKNKIKLNENFIEKIIFDKTVRRNIAKESHYWFFHIYFSHYITHKTAPFHKEMFSLTESKDDNMIVIVSFRGSAKSTIMNLSYPIWSILGKQQKKYILILGQTQQQARQHLKNLKHELENNDLLKKDLGPFEEPDDEWRADAIVIPRFNAKIMCASTEQSIRGTRHNQYRPDLVICDDIEDMDSVKTREGRDKVFNWFKGEIVPSGSENTKFIVIGNLLHEDSLIMRMKKEMEEDKIDGVFKAYPLIDKNGKCLWSSRYPDEKAISKEKRKIGDEINWQREYMLTIISDEGRVIQHEWIQYYDEFPQKEDISKRKFNYVATGIDLAISEKNSADYTAMVSARIYGSRDDRKIYILPYPINKRLSFPKTVETAISLSKNLSNGTPTKLFIEDVGYQRALIQELNRLKIKAEGVPVHGQDKRARLSIISPMIQYGEVLFPKKGAEHLIQQLTGFGVEKHDDLSDALAILLIKLMEEPPSVKFFCASV